MGRKLTEEKNEGTFGKIRRIIQKNGARIHFVGIGGISMYSLACLALRGRANVSGSDREMSDRTARLSSLGAKITCGHHGTDAAEADLVVYSNAVPQDLPEITLAVSRGVPTVSRAEYMGALMPDYSLRIGVSGSHGKSTVTAMLDSIFTAAGKNPTTLSGADLPFGEPYRLGGDSLIYEACEYRDSFLHFLPTVALALNLELDHTDYFDGIESIKRSFVKALRRASDYSVICADDENLRKIRPLLGDKTVSFGLCEDSDYRYRINEYDKSGFGFTVFNRGREMGGFRLNIPGSYNVANATAAIAVATESGIDRAAVFSALSEYRGIGRRLELVGRRGARSVYYDYAHHPTEIRAAINALRIHAGEPITVVFKPHTFSRTKDLWADFVSSLSLADYLIVTDIFGAREQPIPGICAKSLAAAVGRGAIYCVDADVRCAIDRYTRGTVVLMGAGNFDEIKNQVLNK